MPIKKSVSEIVEEWLQQNNCDGLTDEEGCGCNINELFPCGLPQNYCVAAVKKLCIPSDCGGCDSYLDNDEQPLESCLTAKVFKEK